jgi:DNA-binding XRE family transcriptional regulator
VKNDVEQVQFFNISIARVWIFRKKRKMAKKTASRTGSWSKKIVAHREKSGNWHKAMLDGRRESRLNPSIMSLLRIRKDLLQSDIAKALEITEPTYSQIERGHRPVKRDLANKIASQLGAPIAKIFMQQKKKFVAVIQRSNI